MPRSNVKIIINRGDDFQRALRRFKRSCERAGIRREGRRHEAYEKPSERRRREKLSRLRKLKGGIIERKPEVPRKNY